jgi:hypothetical protein
VEWFTLIFSLLLLDTFDDKNKVVQVSLESLISIRFKVLVQRRLSPSRIPKVVCGSTNVGQSVPAKMAERAFERSRTIGSGFLSSFLVLFTRRVHIAPVEGGATEQSWSGGA